jgi:hypothetical protein
LGTFNYVAQQVLVLLFTFSLAAQGQTEAQIQTEVDEAFSAILSTSVGRAVCFQILGANANAISYHLGVSAEAAARFAKDCGKSKNLAWVYPTKVADIRKLSISDNSSRLYKVLYSSQAFPIESWTEPFSNTTVIVTNTYPISKERWIQILAHEMAVYFDSKANPSHPDARLIPELKNLELQKNARLDPLIAVTNPLQAHTLTFIRALQIEVKVLNEVSQTPRFRNIKKLLNSEVEYLVSDECREECLENLIIQLRKSYRPISLPLLAFAPFYRSVILGELTRSRKTWSEGQWDRAIAALDQRPVNFIKNQFTGNPLEDIRRVFYAELSMKEHFEGTAEFLENDLWPLERASLNNTTISGQDLTLLEYLKRPLLSGYNIGLSSGPRVRIRIGVIQ